MTPIDLVAITLGGILAIVFVCALSFRWGMQYQQFLHDRQSTPADDDDDGGSGVLPPSQPRFTLPHHSNN